MPSPADDPVWVWGLPLAPLTFDQALDRIDGLVAAGRPSFFITANLNYAMLGRRRPAAAGAQRPGGVRPGRRDAAGLGVAARPAAAARAGGRVGPDLRHVRAGRPARAPRLPARGRPRRGRRGGREAGREVPGPQDRRRRVPAVPPPTAAEERAGRSSDIRAARPDLLFVAFGQPKGELWIADRLRRTRGTGLRAGRGDAGLRGRARQALAEVDAEDRAGVGVPDAPGAAAAGRPVPGQRRASWSGPRSPRGSVARRRTNSLTSPARTADTT